METLLLADELAPVDGGRISAFRRGSRRKIGEAGARPRCSGHPALPIRPGLTWLLVVTTLHLTYASAFPSTRRRKNHDSQSQPTDRRRERPDQSGAADRRSAAARGAIEPARAAGLDRRGRA